jgi:hypothetical protein
MDIPSCKSSSSCCDMMCYTYNNFDREGLRELDVYILYVNVQ